MENEKGVPEVDFPLLTHLLFYVPWDIKIFIEKKNLRDLYCKRAHIICVRKFYILFFEKNQST